GWMSWIGFVDQFKIRIRSSFDGGQTWSAPVDLPHTVAGYSSADPCLAFDVSGNVYATYIDFTGTTPPVTGAVCISRSTDGGSSWGTPTKVIDTNYDGTKWPIDRPWMIIDHSASASQGNIYVTTFPLNRTNPSFRPYLSVSTDQGATFSTRYIDSTGYLAGSLNPLPLCSHTVTSNGVWHGAYPSLVFTQFPQFQTLMASSSNAGGGFSYTTVYSNTDTISLGAFPDAKKAGLLISNPADPDHLAYVFLRTRHGDLDIFLSESFDSGQNWNAPLRVNDDPVGNARMQDLLWGDFDVDGDLVIAWRDRRNGNDSTYQTDSEIWAAFRDKDSTNFAPNFQISSQLVAFDTILESAGNDFMCIKLQNDTLHAVWGDVRTGFLNIWYQSMATDGTVLHLHPIASAPVPHLRVSPNPVQEWLRVEGLGIEELILRDLHGKAVARKFLPPETTECMFSLADRPNGLYFVEARIAGKWVKQKVLKMHQP
ncbi:MAG: exo-alpha-sialidase, partial [Bacteroidota bacterium]